MGKKAKSVVKKATNVVKNFTPAGYTNALIKKATGTDLIGGAGKMAEGLLAGGSDSPGPVLDRSKFDAQQAINERVKAANEASKGLITQLVDQSQGKGPSLAGAQLKAAQDRNLSQLLAASAAQRGGNPALRQRLASQAQSTMGRDLAQQSALARMQEQQQAQELLGRQTLEQQGQDLKQVMEPKNLLANYEAGRFAADVARRNAVKAQQQGLFSSLLQTGGTLGVAALSDENEKEAPSDMFRGEITGPGALTKDEFKEKRKKLAQAFASQGLASTPGEALSNIAQFAVNAGVFDKPIAQKPVMAVQPVMTVAQPSTQGAYTVQPMPVSMSDEEQKRPPKASKKLAEMLDKLKSYEYEYKDTSKPGTTEGRNFGVMAQDLEKSEVGKELVKDTPHGKMVDMQKTFSAMLAAQADLNKRLRKVEGKKSPLAKKLTSKA